MPLATGSHFSSDGVPIFCTGAQSPKLRALLLYFLRQTGWQRTHV